MNKAPWYKAYPSYSDHVELLEEFTEDEFNATVPFTHMVNINKVTLHEVCVWLKYERAFGRYPTPKQINAVRERLGKWYSVNDFTKQEDNYGEHF